MSEAIAPDPMHAAAVASGVVSAALQDSGASGIFMLAGDTPEGGLALRWLRSALGDERVFDRTTTSQWPMPDDGGAVVRAEAERAAARVFARDRGLLLAHPASKTVLLLSDWLPPESLLPLGDLCASALRSPTGACTLPDDVTAFAEGAGGLDRRDGRCTSGWSGGDRSRKPWRRCPRTRRPPLRCGCEPTAPGVAGRAACQSSAPEHFGSMSLPDHERLG